MQSKLDQYESGNQDAIITKNKLDSCRDELTKEQNSKQQISQDLQRAKQEIKTLEDEIKRHERSMRSANRDIETLKDELNSEIFEKKLLQNELNSEKARNDNLRNQIRQLKNEKSNEERNPINVNALVDSKIVLWDRNVVNGKYVIAYEINSSLHSQIKNMLPKVRPRLKIEFIRH